MSRINNISLSGDEFDFSIGEGNEIKKLDIVCSGTGGKVKIGSGCSINCYIYLDSNSNIYIGDNVMMNGLVVIHSHGGVSVEIDSGCLFAGGVIIRPSDVHKIFDINTNEILNPPSSISISKGVWVGEHVSILKGSHIPPGCVIGTRSVVTKKFTTENSIIAGNPASVVRENIRWDH